MKHNITLDNAMSRLLDRGMFYGLDTTPTIERLLKDMSLILETLAVIHLSSAPLDEHVRYTIATSLDVVAAVLIRIADYDGGDNF